MSLVTTRPQGLYFWTGCQAVSLVFPNAAAAGLPYRAKLVAVTARHRPSWCENNFRSTYEKRLHFAKGVGRPLLLPGTVLHAERP